MPDQNETQQSAAFDATRQRLREYGKLVEEYLRGALDATPIPRLREAMNYSLLAGGKRLRPVLCLACASLFGAKPIQVLPFAAGIEMIHTYSLIHDDLPAMDDDDLRRGRPSNHKAFDEATAILAGDALLTDAFAFMAAVVLQGGIRPERALAALSELAVAAGSGGMVGGQMLDMEYTDARSDSPRNPQNAGQNDGSQNNGQSADVRLARLRHMHSLKTGALFQGSCVAGAILAGATPENTEALREYAIALGAAFQVVDDILDTTQDTATLGKPAGSDAAQGKTTFPSLIGLKASRELAADLARQANTFLSGHTGADAEFLRGLPYMLLHRVN